MKKIIIGFLSFLFIMLLSPVHVFAAITSDTGAAYTACVSGTTCSYSYTVGAITDPLLVCSNSNFNDADPGAVTMTYGGVSMTQIGSNQSKTSVPGTSYMQTFYLAGAATGTHTLAITTTNSQSNGFYAHCVSYGGVNQSTPIEAYTQQVDVNVAVNTDIPATVTTLTDGAWVGMMATDVYARTVVAGASTTKITGCSDAQADCFDTNGPVSPAGNRTLNVKYTNGTLDSFIITAYAIKPVEVYRDTGAAYTACVSGTTCSYSYTVGAITDPLLVCSDSNFNDADPGAVTMTYGGVSMTQIGSNQSKTSVPGTSYMQTFYLAGAATGTHTLAITTTNSQSNGFYAHCVSYGGVNQSTPIEAYTQQVDVNVAVNTDIPATVTTLTDGAWVGMMATDVYARTVVAGASTTKITGCSDAQADCFDTNGPVSPAGNRTLNVKYTNGTLDSFIITAYAIKPA
jgi:predicted alpha/beta hydrolase